MKLSLWTTSHQEPSNDTKSRVGNALHGLGDLNMTYQTNNRYPCSWKGPLVEAKIWKVRISCNQWKGSACNHGPQFCYFGFWGGRGGVRGKKGGGIFHFYLCTHVFPLCSQSSPRHSQKHHMCSGKCSSFHLQAGQKGRTPCIKIKPYILGNLHGFLFLGDGPIKLLHCRKKQIKEWTWEVPI